MIFIKKYISVIVIGLILLLSAIYAGYAIKTMVIDNEYKSYLMPDRIILDEDKIYLFGANEGVREPGTIIVPVNDSIFPDDLCTLYYENGWFLKLGDSIRSSNKDGSVYDIFFPWCCKYDNSEFYAKGAVIDEKVLMGQGVKFNIYSYGAAKRVFVKLEKKNGQYYLQTNRSFLGYKIPISALKENVIEVSFCDKYSVSDKRFVCAFPFKGNDDKSETIILNVHDGKAEWENKSTNIKNDITEFSIRNVHFILKKNHSDEMVWMLIVMCVILVVWSGFHLFRLFWYVKETKRTNVLSIERVSVTELRILFNSVVLAGYPILIIKSQSDPQRIFIYGLMVLFLNILWYKIKSIDKGAEFLYSLFNKYVLHIIVIVIVLMMLNPGTESFYGIPVIHVAKMLYLLMPFVANSSIVLRFNDKIRPYVEYIIMLSLSGIIVCFSYDMATLVFTIISILLINIVQKEKRDKIIGLLQRRPFICGIIVLLVMFWLYALGKFYMGANPKIYRMYSVYYLPHEEFLEGVDEGARETVAEQIYLIKSVLADPFNSDFNKLVLPSWKTTYFSDYNVLWNIKIGGVYFLIIYVFILVLMVYAVVRLLILLNSHLLLESNQGYAYKNKIFVQSLNILLSLLLVQYVYTLLSNLWVLPVTGQSPGILCPSYVEVGMHILLINIVGYYLERKRGLEDDEKVGLMCYRNVKRVWNKSVKWIFVFIVFMVYLQFQKISEFKDSSMSWQIKQSGQVLHNTDKEDLKKEALNAFQQKDKVLYQDLIKRYYNRSDSDVFATNMNYIYENTLMVNYVKAKKRQLKNADGEVMVIEKKVNGRSVYVINDGRYSGFPLVSNTVNTELQKMFNSNLEQWRSRIKAEGYSMLGGSIIVAKNESGDIVVSASYPLIFNETPCHLIMNENNGNGEQNLRLGRYKDMSYVNMAEYDVIPGSIIKPLVYYGVLKLYDRTRQNNSYSNRPMEISLSGRRIDLEEGLKKSDNDYAREILRKADIDSLKTVIRNDFSIGYFSDIDNDKKNNLDDKTLQSFAIGQQQPISFRKIVQAYTRIKTGRKVLYRYDANNYNNNVEDMSLGSEGMNQLRRAMMSVFDSDGTASVVARELRNNGIDFSSFMGKTGTAQVFKDENHNRSSSFIIITDDYTVGVQLFGNLPDNQKNLSAKDLFNKIIPELKRYNIIR